MNLMKKVFVLIFVLLAFSISFSFNRNLPWIDIISRKQWWADSKYLYADYKAYKQMILAQKKYIEKLKKDKLAYKRWLEKQAIRKTQEKYLLKNWKQQVKADKYIPNLNWKRLFWPFSYKYHKVSIIIHHTDSDYRKFKSIEDVKKFIRGVYYYHAIKRWWWDIGYNFLIWPYWNIYEWRAGGDSVVGANSEWNNVSSIGIALIWNFEIQKPTPAQIKSLIKLSTALAKKYNINPYSKVVYHESYPKYPYIKDVTYYALAGHRDTGHTKCPGKYLYNLLPFIRKEVFNDLKAIWNSKEKNNKIRFVSKKITQIVNLPLKFTLSDTLVLNFSGNKFLKCNSNVKNLEIFCKSNKVFVKLKYPLPVIYQPLDFKLFQDKINYIVRWKAIFMSNLRLIIKNKVNKKYFFHPKLSVKIKKRIYLKDLSNINNLPVNVLLYELSWKNHYDFRCSKVCVIYTDKRTYTAKTFSVDKFNNLLLWINWKLIKAKYIKIDSLWGFIKFTNYSRKSYAGIPWNFFRGEILIKKDYIKKINSHKIFKKYVVINKLSLQDYLKWIAEWNDQMPMEKLKVMALLAKDYVLFYQNKKNIHPFIPKWASYNAVDDPRIFQKYVGAGFEATSKKWAKALDFIKNKVLLYNWYIPILPYFSCSAGFTFSAKQKFWRIDTPYLVNTPDLGNCGKFYWHWVWLSGKWAEILAKKWLNYKQIIQWYFPGVYVETY